MAEMMPHGGKNDLIERRLQTMPCNICPASTTGTPVADAFIHWSIRECKRGRCLGSAGSSQAHPDAVQGCQGAAQEACRSRAAHCSEHLHYSRKLPEEGAETPKLDIMPCASWTEVPATIAKLHECGTVCCAAYCCCTHEKDCWRPWHEAERRQAGLSDTSA